MSLTIAFISVSPPEPFLDQRRCGFPPETNDVIRLSSGYAQIPGARGTRLRRAACTWRRKSTPHRVRGGDDDGGDAQVDFGADVRRPKDRNSAQVFGRGQGRPARGIPEG